MRADHLRLRLLPSCRWFLIQDITTEFPTWSQISYLWFLWMRTRRTRARGTQITREFKFPRLWRLVNFS